MVLDVVGPLGGEEGHRAPLGGEAPLGVEGLPGARLLVLGEGETVLPRVPLGRAVEEVGHRVQAVDEDEADRPADGGVRPVAGAENVSAAVHADFVPDRSVRHHEGGGAPGARGAAVKVVGRVGHGLERRQQHGHVGGKAARHDGVQGHLPGRDGAPPLFEAEDHLALVHPARLEELRQALSGGRDHGKAVRPPPAVVLLDGGVEIRAMAQGLHRGPPGAAFIKDSFDNPVSPVESGFSAFS